MTDDSAFLRAIQANPDDIALRLVYADFLEERGDARAEYIRILCQLAQAPADPQRYLLLARRAALRNAQGRDWVRRLQHLCLSCHLRYGLLETVVLDVHQFVKHAEVLFALGPVCEVKVLCPNRKMEKLAASEHLMRCAVLDLSYNFLNNDALVTLAASPHLANLRELRLAHNKSITGAAGALALATTSALANLHLLDLRSTRIDETGRQALRARFGARVRL
jgi:uncharacterized protein (TIGR02996 family)